ncbi:MAG: glycosyltransferase family 8 protein [Opitutales bacterium]|jgi:lipopolysaccharide biosynthesis glycosyltransferase
MDSTNKTYPVVFCSDRNMLAALHVAALTILENFEGRGRLEYHLFHDSLEDADIELLRETLSGSSKDWTLTAHLLEAKELEGFPTLMGSTATYLRLFVPNHFDCPRILYCDIDTLCRVDLSELFEMDMEGCPAGMIPEAPITACADPGIVSLLGDRASGNYFNAGVLLVDCEKWKADNLTSECLEFLASTPVNIWDQSALNFVLHGMVKPLPVQYNCRTNDRSFWPHMVKPGEGQGRFLHFIDFPKPWSPFGKCVHPMGRLWKREYRKTAHFRERLPVNPKGVVHILKTSTRGYVKVLKDRLLFFLLENKLVKKVKGM